jgi:hypothetical protein
VSTTPILGVIYSTASLFDVDWGMKHTWVVQLAFGKIAWNEANLLKCTNDELADLSRRMGLAFSGSRERRVSRLLNAYEVRKAIKGYGNWPEDADHWQVCVPEVQWMMKEYRADELRARAQVHFGQTERSANRRGQSARKRFVLLRAC